MNNYLKKIPALLVFIAISVAVGAQTVTAEFRNTPLKAVLTEVESQSGYSFMYRNEDLSAAGNVTATFKTASLVAVLDKVLGRDYTYFVQGKVVSITKAGKQAVPAAARVASYATPEQTPQEKMDVKGLIADQNGQPVIGAAVTVKGDSSFGGAVSDFEGRFAFSAPQGVTLQVTCIGYVPKEFVLEKEELLITLEEDNQILEDVVVVGYGVQKKESVVGAISQVSSEALVNSGQTNITQAMSGKIPGVYSYQTSGQPGSDDATFYIRGYSSWNGSSPLVMVDGVERSFNDLDPNEVETISVLKDASATAVFGAKGANGVILVTTKTGKEGKAKTHLSVNMGLESPTLLPQTYDAETILRALNLGLRNDAMFGSQHSEEEINNYMSGENTLRYPQNNWYDLMLRNFATSTNTSYGVSGGTSKVRYYVNLGYNYEGSILKNLPGMVKNFSSHRINYRSNLDFNLTKSTKLSVKFGGYSKVNTQPGDSGSGLFTDMYNASTIQYPAYFPENVLEIYKDTDYPDATGFRRAGKGDSGVYYDHPYNTVADGSFTQKETVNLNTDAELNQKLDFITRGLSINGKISYATTYHRTAQSASESYPTYYLDWNAIDTGEGNPWIASNGSTEVYVQAPYKVSKSNTPSSTVYNFYWETSANYDRSFGEHNVSALALMHQRNYVLNADFPSRTQAYVGRVNYNYAGRYMLETNIGITGSEQFAPKNRYGVFPSLAVGYYLSREEFWKNAMPWWSTMKVRYSDGYVGSDNATESWLYYSSYEKSGDYIKESAAANETARWEKAHKRNLGFEMGWLKDNLVLNVELFDEYRSDILVTPLTTIFVVVDYKDINAGEMKKHGMEVELKWRNTTASGLYYEVGGMVGLNENRILAYPDSPYSPDYQKQTGKQYGSPTNGESLVDDNFFGTIDQKHGYPGAGYTNPQGRDYKFLDYDCDGAITNDDRHPVNGSLIPPVTYSGHVALSYKGFSFDATLMGCRGKYISLEDVYYIEFYKGDYILHSNSMNYWTPTNTNANHASLSSLEGAIKTFGRSDAIGTNCSVVDVLWQKSDYLSIKDVRLAYKLEKSKFVERLGVKGLTFTVTGNNLHTFTKVKDADPEVMDLQNSYYPIMRNVKLGVSLDF